MTIKLKYLAAIAGILFMTSSFSMASAPQGDARQALESTIGKMTAYNPGFSWPDNLKGSVYDMDEAMLTAHLQQAKQLLEQEKAKVESR